MQVGGGATSGDTVSSQEFPEMLQEIIDKTRIYPSRILIQMRQDCTGRGCETKVTSVKR